MAKIAGKKSGLVWAAHLSVAALVVLWLLPTTGLFISSFRTADQIADEIMGAVHEWTGTGPQDDATLIVVSLQ